MPRRHGGWVAYAGVFNVDDTSTSKKYVFGVRSGMEGLYEKGCVGHWPERKVSPEGNG